MIEQNTTTILQSPMHRLECLNVIDEIIDGMDDKGILELMQGSQGDIDYVLDNLMKDTFQVMYTGDTNIDFSPKYTDRLSYSIEETLRTRNLTYFITSVMPDFQLSWHHLEWCDLVHRHNKLCVVAARDHGKSIARDTLVVEYNGRLKRADEVKVGDLLMGVDSTPRRVTAIYKGLDEHMYRIDQSKGDSYTVNSRHINTCIQIGKRGRCLEEHEKHIVDVDMPTLLSYSNNYIRENIRTFKVAWEMPYKKVKVDPYFLGLWLGDGRSNIPMIINEDTEVIDFLKEYANTLGLYCRSYQDIDHYLVEKNGFGSKDKNKNCLYYMMDYYNVFNNKHIPNDYLYNSKEVRLKLLAGLLDSDGTLSCESTYSFSNSNKKLLENVVVLCNSLGFRTVLDNKNNYVRLSGKIDEIPVKIERKKIRYDWKNKQNTKDWGTIDGITPSVVSSIKITDVGEGEYVSITTDGDHRFLLGDGTVTHNSYFFSNAYAAWQLYRYSKPKSGVFSARPTKASSNRGYLFSFSLQQSVDLMEILKGTIEGNDILRDRLFPNSKTTGAWASTNIVCKNGARLTCKGFGSSVRGAHPYWIVVDDGLKDNVIYSAMQRQKSIDYFHSVIMNMLVPGGQIIVVGTPFHASDLYGDLKSKATKDSRGWFVIEYPAIFPDGRILWPHRWSFLDLMDKKNTQGNIIFSRENLCRPITNESSIFPLKVLERSLLRMENYTLVRNRDDFPIKFNKVVMGCDFAISANVGSDYTVFTTWGVDDESREMYLLNFYREKGKTFHEQMQVLRGLNVRFRPECMVMEQNTFQQIFVQEGDKQGMPVMGHTTGIDKYDLKTGWPGIAILFERGKIHIPIGDEYSQTVKDLIFSDLGSVAFTDKGLESVGEHDDISSSIWLATLGANKLSTGFRYSFI
jgi:phage terminase large subunit-like protein